MACEYFVNGKSYSEIQFKQLLNNGLLDSLIKTNNLELSDFPIDEGRVSKKKSILKSVQSIPVSELQKLLIEEIKSSRNSYPEGMISALELNEKQTNFKLPLWSSPYAIKFESLLTSLVTKRIIKQKFKGGSYVLGSQEGFKYVEGLSIEESLYKFSAEAKKSDIIFTENFNEKDGLQPMRYDHKTKKMLPAQILLPFKFRDAEGNLLKAKDFTREVNGRIVIDTSAIPQELLMLFGFRIPTQGLNSMTMVEIVGFLPEVMGDLVIAPRDFTVQMGSDFDVDKLYSYKKDSFFKDGKFFTNFLSNEDKIEKLLIVVKDKINSIAEENIKNKEDLQLFKDYVEALAINKEEGEEQTDFLFNIIDSLHLEKNELKKELRKGVSDIKLLSRSYEAHLKNKIFDIHMAVMSNAHPEVVKAMVKPDGFGKFVGLAEELDALQQEELLSPLSETYQRNQYVNASSGKLGVGVFSLDSTFNALLQGKDIVYMNVSAEDMEGLPKTAKAIREANKPVATFGDNVSDGYMSDKYTIASQKIVNAAKGRELSKEERQKLVLKSDIIQALQSLAVDNAKEQLMPKLNISNNTFDAIRALAILGFEEVDIIGLINQPIVTEYLKRLEKEQSSIVEFRPNVAEELLVELQVKYDPDNTLLKTENKEALANISGDELMNIIKEGKQPQALTSKEFVSDINKQQLLLLDKFIKLSEIGKTFKTIQSTINTQSKGIPKNLIETSLKVDQVSKIESTGVFNAEKLLGEFSAGQLVKPTTLNGFATYYGLMEADKMYRKFFPYSASGFKNVTQEAINYTNKEEKGVTAQAELQKDIMENLRSYLFSNEETDLFNDNIENERRRLFLDVNGNKSLATILKNISTQEWFKKNKFLSQLTPSANKNGQLSRIFNEAAVGDNFDESDIYVSFLNLFTNNTLEIGTYNGIKYTPFKLAEDLITYAYLEGGKQGAKQFIKYIPPVYLKNTKLGSYLNSLYFNFEELGGIPNFNGSVNYFNPSRFIRQYFQNNPSKVPTTSILEMENVKEKDIKTLSSFSLSTLGKAKHKKVIRQEGQLLTTYNKFVVLYDNSISEKYALFEYNSTTKVYERIPVVSDEYDFSNYNPTMPFAQPIQSNRYSTNKVIPLQEGYTNSEQDLSDLVDFDDTVIKNTKPLNIIADFEINDSLPNVDKVKDLLTQISKSKDVSDTFRLLANKYSKMDFSIADSSKKPFKLEIINDDKGIRGGFNTDTNTLTLNKAIDTTSEKLIETLIHETSHIFTSALIKADPKTLTEEQKEIIQNLTNLQSRYKEHLKATRSVKDLYAFRNAYIALTVKDIKEANRLIAKPIEGLEDIPMDSILEISNEITQKAVSKFYGAIKLEEFVTMALTDKDFQQHLNSIKDKTTSKTFFENILDLLTNILETLGFNVAKDSVLATAIKDSLQLIESSQVNIVNNPKEFINHSGGAYGGDTFWDIIGREFNVINHKHYKDLNNSNLSKQLKNKGIQATILSKEQMDKARIEVEKLLGKKYDDTLQGNLQVRNYYQVINSDAVFAIAKLDTNRNFDSSAVLGGTNTAVQLGIKLNKPVYVWDIFTEQWYIFQTEKDLFNQTISGKFIKTETPTLTKNFAGIGSRDIEDYNILNKETNKWESRKEYVGKEKEIKAKQAIRDVYEKTFKESSQSITQSTNTKVENKSSIVKGKWTKDSPKENPNTAYIFTENINSIGSSRVGGGSAVIRNNPNAIGVVTKKYYVYSEDRATSKVTGGWNQDFQNTEADFELFKKVNLEQFAKIDKYESKIFPQGFASDLAKIPTRFAEWLQSELLNRYGLVTELNTNKTGLVSVSTIKQTAPQVVDKTITYTPIGKTQQTYTIKGSQIFNSKGIEVFAGDSKDRNRIFANLAVQDKKAVVVEHKDKKYVVNQKGKILSVATGDVMKWGEENGDRKDIIKLANTKFDSMQKPLGTISIKDLFDINDSFNNTDQILPSNLDNTNNYSSFVEKMREYNQNCK